MENQVANSNVAVPAKQLKTNRGLVKFILLSIIIISHSILTVKSSWWLLL